MATTTGDCTVFDALKGWLGDNTVNLDTSTLGVLLLKDNTNAPDRAADTMVSDVISGGVEVTTGGYARKTFSGSWTTSGGANGQMMLDVATNPVWSVTGTDMTAHYWVLYDNTNGTDATREVLAFGLLDTTAGGTDVVTTVGNSLTLNVNALGFFTVG